ncbi:MAG: DsbC family protein [Nitrospinae bacterium]|nr:DsbC family protein [Nitrospinota bacterium]
MTDLKKILVAAALAVLAAASPVHAGKDDTKAVGIMLKQQYPAIPVDTVSKTDIEGLFEVASGTNIFYYHLKTNSIVTGEIIRGGRSITAQRRGEIMSRLLKDVPLAKAVKIGSGKNVVIEFSDPDCPYCRQVDGFFAKRNDLTLYVFLLPLPMHPDAPKKSLKVLCSADPVSAYREAMGGKYDTPFTLPSGCEAKAGSLLQEHITWGQRLGVQGTPAIWVNGTWVEGGANVQALETLLAKGPAKGK